MAVVATDDGRPVAAAAVFTTNLAAAAPVQVSRAHLAGPGVGRPPWCSRRATPTPPPARPGGRRRRGCASWSARGSARLDGQVLVCQTGLIGVPFPLAVAVGRRAPAGRPVAPGRGGRPAAATAIMTTDTFAKEVHRCDAVRASRSGGMAKGAAMLAPNMATMLAVLTTDAEVDPATLQARCWPGGGGPRSTP